MKAYFEGDKDVYTFKPVTKAKCGRKKKTTTTNADHIRAMSDEDLASLIGGKSICPSTGECTRQYGDCTACWLEWLKQPYKEDA